MSRSNSASAPVLTIGYCTDDKSEKALIAYGVDPLMIWRQGRDIQALELALRYPRGRETILAVAEDLRILGDSRKAIFKQVRDLEAEGITVLDVVANDNNALTLVEAALVAKSAEAGMRNHRTARRRGRVGGIAKGIAAAVERESGVPAWLIRKIVNHPLLTWAIVKDLIGDIASVSTLRRRYVDQP